MKETLSINRRVQTAESVSQVHDGLETPDQQAYSAMADDRPDNVQDWRPTADLEAPPPRPGYVQRFIRTHVFGVDDTKNWSRRVTEGWRPRLASTVPEGHSPPTISFGNYGDVVGVYGMVLCELPARMKAQRDAHYAAKSRQQAASATNQMESYAAQAPGKVEAFGEGQQRVQLRKGAPSFQDDSPEPTD